MLLVSPRIIDRYRKLRCFHNWVTGADIDPKEETIYTAQYREVIVKNVGNGFCTQHQCVPVMKPECILSNNLFSSATALVSSQSFFNPYHSSSNNEKCWTPNHVAETTPGQSNRTACLLTGAMLYLHSPPKAPQNWGQIHSYLNGYYSNPTEISSTVWIPHITDWWCEQEETHSKYADLSNVACNIISIIAHGIWVEARFLLGKDVIDSRRSTTTGETLFDKVVVRQFAWAQNKILAGNVPELDTTNTENDSEKKSEMEESKLHRMATVHDLLEMLQGSQNLHATQKKSRTQN